MLCICVADCPQLTCALYVERMKKRRDQPQAHLSCFPLTLTSSKTSWKFPSLLPFLNRRTSSSLRLRPTTPSSSFLLIFSYALLSLLARSFGLNRACMRTRTVVSNEIVFASPRISTPPAALLFSFTQRKDSPSPPCVCNEKVPETSAEGIMRNDS